MTSFSSTAFDIVSPLLLFGGQPLARASLSPYTMLNILRKLSKYLPAILCDRGRQATRTTVWESEHGQENTHAVRPLAGGFRPRRHARRGARPERARRRRRQRRNHRHRAAPGATRSEEHTS